MPAAGWLDSLHWQAAEVAAWLHALVPVMRPGARWPSTPIPFRALVSGPVQSIVTDDIHCKSVADIAIALHCIGLHSQADQNC
jgi:hypothetical protein